MVMCKYVGRSPSIPNRPQGSPCLARSIFVDVLVNKAFWRVMLVLKESSRMSNMAFLVADGVE